MSSKYTTYYGHEIQYLQYTGKNYHYFVSLAISFNLHNDSKQNISTIHVMDLFHLDIIKL